MLKTSDIPMPEFLPIEDHQHQQSLASVAATVLHRCDNPILVFFAHRNDNDHKPLISRMGHFGIYQTIYKIQVLCTVQPPPHDVYFMVHSHARLHPDWITNMIPYNLPNQILHFRQKVQKCIQSEYTLYSWHIWTVGKAFTGSAFCCCFFSKLFINVITGLDIKLQKLQRSFKLVCY